MRMKIICNMKEKYQAIETLGSGLVCDSETCEYSYDVKIDIKDLHNYVDAPCPKCGENLLTEEDYVHHKYLHKMIRLVNILFWPYMFLRGGKKEDEISYMRYHHHDGNTTLERKEAGDEGL